MGYLDATIAGDISAVSPRGVEIGLGFLAMIGQSSGVFQRILLSDLVSAFRMFHIYLKWCIYSGRLRAIHVALGHCACLLASSRFQEESPLLTGRLRFSQGFFRLIPQQCYNVFAPLNAGIPVIADLMDVGRAER